MNVEEKPQRAASPAQTRCWLLATSFFCAAHLALAQTNISSPWTDALKAQLAGIGIELDEASAAKASRFAVLQTIDPQCRAIDTNALDAIRGHLSGLSFHPGIKLSMSNGLPIIASVKTGSPAEKIGLAPGDTITGIGTNVFTKLTLPEARGFFRSSTAITNPATIVRDGITNTIDLAFEPLPLDAIESAEHLHNGFACISVNGLFAGAGSEISRMIQGWATNAHAGALLDLRGAAGNDEESIRQIANLFIPPGQFLYAHRDHQGRDIQIVKTDGGDTLNIPVMVLVDRKTTGAAEILAAALQATSKSVLVIGEPTSGEFLLRERVDFDGEAVYMATRVLDTADGIRYKGTFGVAPAIAIAESERATHDYDPPVDLLDRRQRLEIEAQDAGLRMRLRGDGMLERAVDLLISLKTLNKPSSGVSSPAP